MLAECVGLCSPVYVLVTRALEASDGDSQITSRLQGNLDCRRRRYRDWKMHLTRMDQ